MLSDYNSTVKLEDSTYIYILASNRSCRDSEYKATHGHLFRL